MTTQTLSHLTLQTVDNYRAAANQAVVAYRLGSHRLVNVLNAALENSVYPRTAKLAPKATRRMDGVREDVSEVVVKGIDQVAERTEQAIEMSASAAAAQVKKVARFAAGVDNDIVASGLQAAARLSMPGAKVALAVSGKVAEGAGALADAAGARPVRKAVRSVASKAAPKVARKARVQVKPVQRQAAPVARRTKRAVNVASKRVAAVAKASVAPTAAPVRRAKRAAKKVVAAAKSA